MRRYWKFHAAYLVFLTLLYHEVVFSGWRFIARDLPQYFVPMGAALADAWRGDGSFLWQRGIDNGLPLAARWSPTVFYPTTVLYSFLPPDLAIALAMLVHLFVSAAATFHLAGRYTSNTTAAWLAGLGYAFGGYSVSMLGGGFYLFGASLLPVGVLAFHRLVERPGAGRTLQLSAILALQVFCADPQTLFFEVLIIFPAVLLLGAQSGGQRARAALWGICAGVAAAALAFCQIWPTLEFAELSSRAAGLSLTESQTWDLHPLRVLEMVVPFVFGGYTPETTYWARSLINAQNLHVPWALCIHVGMVLVVGLLACPFADKRHRAALVTWGGLTVFFALCALGHRTPVHAFLHQHLPGVSSFRFPEKFMVFVSLGLCLLGAVGLKRLLCGAAAERAAGTRERLSVAISAVLALFLLAGAGARLVFAPEAQSRDAWMAEIVTNEAALVSASAALDTTAAALSRWTAVVAALLLLWLARRRLRPALLASGLVLIAAIDLFTAGIQQRAVGPPGFLDAAPAACSHIPPPDHGLLPKIYRSPHLGRIPSNIFRHYVEHEVVARRTSDVETLMPNVGTVFCASYAFGYEAARLDQHLKTVNALAKDPKRFMDISGVSRIVARPGEFDPTVFPPAGREEWLDMVVHENDGLPYAHAVRSVESVRDPDAAVDRVAQTEFDYRTRAVFESDSVLPDQADAPRTARLVHHRSGAVVLETSFGAPGYLMVLETHYPGWQASVDGTPVRLHRANGTFMGLSVPEGEHVVTLTFDPPRQRFANRVSAAALLAAAGLFLGARLRRRREAR
ncbi:MAG: YfhO family protein [Deltaproteobacteria bacterium]|nr:YfhO family protein [Deltaproteobacteria bacterium]